MFHWATLAHCRILARLLFGPMSGIVLATLLYRDPLWILLLAVGGETTSPTCSFHIQLSALSDRNRCCCTTHFSTPTSRSSPSGTMSACMNFCHTLETALRLMFICMVTQLAVTTACRMVIIIMLLVQFTHSYVLTTFKLCCFRVHF